MFGFFINFWATGPIIICKEYIRFLIINNAFEKQKKRVGLGIVFIFSILEITDINIIGFSGLYIFKQIITKILPIISKNILFTYIAYCKLYLPCILYELSIYSILWMSPILPNLNSFITAIIDITIPTLLFIYIRYIKTKNNFTRNKKETRENKPFPTIFSIICIIISIWFSWGVFPIKPIAIASASMEPNISIGDIVIVKKCSIDDLEVGDVIEYNKNGISIIHRILEINYYENKFSYLVAQGDNNEVMDKKVLEEQIVGKCLFKIKYLGYPAVWISNLRQY